MKPVGLATFLACAAVARCGVSTPFLVNPCLNTSFSFSKMPWCDPTLPIDQRISDMLSRMTLDEKIGSLRDKAVAIDSLGLPAYNWWSEATHGVADMRKDWRTPWTTSFAFPITTSMSFNRTLWRKTGEQIGREARALMNAGNAYSTFWAPVVNLARDPRWGRNIETPGEDPYLSGEYATEFVKGFQESPDDPYHLQASACCKHYVANEMESSNVAGVHWDRHHFNANITTQDLVDSYMAPFQACVEKGRVSSLMCSYNAVNGVPSCASPWLLQDIARDAWGFDGYITSDCDADADVLNSHHFTKTPEETVRDVLRAGTDSDCGSFVVKYARSALDKGLISEVDIDGRLAMLFKVRMRLSHFDPLGPLNRIPTADVCSDYGKDLAREGVGQAAALLKNENGRLPLDATSLKSVAVIGPNANLSQKINSYYGPHNPCELKYWSMVDAIQQYVAQTTTALGLPSVASNDTSGTAAAVRLAAAADAVVLVLGTDLDMAREGLDAVDIAVPAGQRALLRAVAGSAKQPVVVVTLTAVPLDLTEWLADPKVGAILHVGQPAVQTLGVGDVLFGKRVPAGRLVQTIYPASYASQVSIFDFNMRPGPSVWPRPDCPKSEYGHCPLGTNPGRTHRFYTGRPVLPFGFGLSYTSFRYEVVQAPASLSLAPLGPLLAGSRHGFLSSRASAAIGPAARYSVTVTNTGSTDADDVVLGFLVPPEAGRNGIPLQVLFGFERVHVPAGESRTVDLYPTWTDFTHVDTGGRRGALPGLYEVRFGLRWPGAGSMGSARRALAAHLEPELVV
eukprot:CAMPEP_0179121212 /NCGR_PEP_ID=MMETSP0796-20121207/57152_1 /TAXON_ID=73915 /ORGANISM="Pyrodinium bahamense, Strain pbaha01" /LENGTH=794 /DNA_ID=CAMNT_0020819793 /DNA_START=44 /DNA_END=2428 /DNA_ORIENTATION=+